jgi:uncharacterized membrane protein YdjX (TVP38/TMEM64 family)
MRRALRLGGLIALLLAFVLVPFVLFGSALDAWVVGTLESISTARLLAVALIAGVLAADVVLPTPSSVVSTAAGALLGVPLGAAVSWVGMSLGCAFGYWLGTKGRGAARGFIGQDDLARAEAVSAGHGAWSVAVLRAVPVLAEASVVLAGVAGMKRSRFYLIALPANAGISLAYAGVGAYAANISSFLLALAGAITLPLLAMLAARFLTAKPGLASTGPAPSPEGSSRT